MLAAILALLQEGHTAASETTEHAGAAAEHAEPWLVEQVNHIIGPAVLSLERVVMPPIYGIFGAHWHEPAHGELVIPCEARSRRRSPRDLETSPAEPK